MGHNKEEHQDTKKSRLGRAFHKLHLNSFTKFSMDWKTSSRNNLYKDCMVFMVMVAQKPGRTKR